MSCIAQVRMRACACGSWGFESELEMCVWMSLEIVHFSRTCWDNKLRGIVEASFTDAGI